MLMHFGFYIAGLFMLNALINNCVHTISVLAVKTRLRSYRTMFRRTYKQLPSGSGLQVAAISSPKKRLLKMLWFLKEHLRLEPTISNLAPSNVSFGKVTFSRNM